MVNPFLASQTDFASIVGEQSEGNIQLIERVAICRFLLAAFMAPINALVFSEGDGLPLFWMRSSVIAGDAISFESPLALASGRYGMVNSRPRIAIGV